MKGRGRALDRTKVVLRHLPPSITKAMLMEPIDAVFAGRYDWVSFRPRKTNQKNQIHSRAYINFKCTEDVVEFAEFFDGHIFVNEKGAQFKTIVEYAPSQRVPKKLSKKDGREGTILKDPEYLEFLKLLATPIENLPSAEVQLERREAEQSGDAKDAPIITPLMDFVRQKRASGGGSKRSGGNGKSNRRVGKFPAGSRNSESSKQSSEKQRISKSMDTTRKTRGKENSSILVLKRGDIEQSVKSCSFEAALGAQPFEEDSGVSATADPGKEKILLSKGKDRENFPQEVKNVEGSAVDKYIQQREGKSIIRSILINKDVSRCQSKGHSDDKIQKQHVENKKNPSLPQNVQAASSNTSSGHHDRVASSNFLGFGEEQQEKNAKKMDKPSHRVQVLFRNSEGSCAIDDSPSSAASLSTKSMMNSSEGSVGVQILERGYRNRSSLDNGFHKAVNRRCLHGGKDARGLMIAADGSSSPGRVSRYSSHEVPSNYLFVKYGAVANFHLISLRAYIPGSTETSMGSKGGFWTLVFAECSCSRIDSCAADIWEGLLLPGKTGKGLLREGA